MPSHATTSSTIPRSYWLTNTATSAARLYWQEAKTGRNFYAAADLSFPTAVTVFPGGVPSSAAPLDQKAYHNQIHFKMKLKRVVTSLARKEQRQLFSEELRVAFRTLR